MADQEDPFLPEARAQPARELERIRQGLAHAQGFPRGRRVEGLSRAAPVPVDHDEIALPLALERVSQEHAGHSLTPMEEEQDRFGAVVAPDQHPLTRAAERERLELGHGALAVDRRRTATAEYELPHQRSRTQEQPRSQDEPRVAGTTTHVSLTRPAGTE